MVTEEILKEESSLKYLKEQEFLHGERPDGSRIGYYGSVSYAKQKQRQNPLAGGKVDLIKSGDFVYSAYLLKPVNKSWLFGFRDGKTSDLMRKYNTGMNGQKNLKSLNQKTFTKFERDIIAPRFIRRFNQALGIGK